MRSIAVKTIHYGDSGYPYLLRHIHSPPDPFYMMGELHRDDTLSVAIVGSRSPTSYGRMMAEKLSRDLARRGITIISGFARGIDNVAHSSALSEAGRTIAVLGCGLNVDYPRGAGKLKGMIAANGAVLTEYTDGTPPLPGNFPRRNRIISGLSVAVIVIEAGVKSGSLITARMALEQGRDVMAVPGRVDSALSVGPLKLISEGAAPVRDADDVLCALGIDLPGTTTIQVESSPLLEILAKSPSTVDELAESTGRTVRSMLAELTELEIDGRIKRDINGNFTLK